MNELIDVLNFKGDFLGKSFSKSEIHKKGYFHNTAHVWFYTNNGQILLQQRSASKTICPLLWDVSVAGHVDADESVTEAAIRETYEEIGLRIEASHLNKIGVFECFQKYDNGIIDNEFHHTYVSELKKDIQDLNPNSEEVEALKLVSIEEFSRLLEESNSNRHFIESNKTYYLAVLNSIILTLSI